MRRGLDGEVTVRGLVLSPEYVGMGGAPQNLNAPQPGGALVCPNWKNLALAQAGGEAPPLQAGPCPSGFGNFILQSEHSYLLFF